MTHHNVNQLLCYKLATKKKFGFNSAGVKVPITLIFFFFR